MTVRSLFVALFLLGKVASGAMSLLPIHQNYSVAANPGAEEAGAVVFGGTNFLIAYRGDCQHAAADQTNQIMARLISPNGELLGAPISMPGNGSAPFAAYGAGQFVVAWQKDNSFMAQRITPDGALSGTLLVVEPPLDGAALSALVFDGHDFLLIWVNAGAPSRIAGWRLGLNKPFSICIESTAVAGVSVTAGGTNLCVSYMRQREGTNLWDTVMRTLEETTVSAPQTISAVPAQRPYATGSGFDGTNFLVAWSRETAPVPTRPYAQQDFSTNYPMIWGRIVGASGELHGTEIQITRARYGQFSPKLMFDGSNFVVVWLDLRVAGTAVPHLQFVSRAGKLAGYELPLSFESANTLSPVGPVFGAAAGSGKIVCAFARTFWNRLSDVWAVVISDRPVSSPPAVRWMHGSRGTSVVRVEGDPGTRYNVFMWTNAIHPPPVFDWYFSEAYPVYWPYDHYLPNVYLPRTNYFVAGWAFGGEVVRWAGYTTEGGWPTNVPVVNGGLSVVDACDCGLACLYALQKIYVRKHQWALATGADVYAVVSDVDLFSVKEWPKPDCPHDGTLMLGIMTSRPICSIPEHNTW